MKIWMSGKEYELPKDLEEVMDLIDDAKKRQAPNDLSQIAYQILHVALEALSVKEKAT